MGYEQVRKRKCAWCKTEHLMKDLREIGEGKYAMCSYCREGLAAAEWRLSENPDASKIIETMLAEASASKDSFPSGFNDFIGMANITIHKTQL